MTWMKYEQKNVNVEAEYSTSEQTMDTVNFHHLSLFLSSVLRFFFGAILSCTLQYGHIPMGWNEMHIHMI